jgi:hypothetical protein
MLDRGNSQRIAVVAIIGLIVIAVLAVNGGMVILQRQIAQNAVDAASLAAALALTQGYSSDQIEYVALERAGDHGFNADDPDTSVKLSWMSEIVGAGASYSNFLRVSITTSYRSIFSSIFNSKQDFITVDAISHARMDEDLAPGYAVVALNGEGCKEGSGAECWGGTAGVSAFSIPVTGGTQAALSEIPLPDCSSLPDYGDVVVGDSAILQPGRYASITVGVSASVNMNPGLYCIYGSGFDGNSFLMDDYTWVSGEDIMVYMMEGAGDFQTSPTSASYLYAPEDLIDQSGHQWGGMLVYAHPDNDSNFIFTGTSKTTFRGTIYAPGAQCEAKGTAGFVTLKSQMVCDTVRFFDVNGLYVSYDMSTNYHMPEAVEIMD